MVARTEHGPSWFLVDAGTPGFEIVRDIPTVEPFDTGGHAEIRLDGCRVGADALVGEEGQGLAHSQLRLEGARLFHCMRYIGLASRAMQIAQDYAAMSRAIFDANRDVYLKHFNPRGSVLVRWKYQAAFGAW